MTFTGNDVLNHDIVTVEGTIGFILRNFCIDMDESATNDALNGIAIGPTGGLPIKHGVIENVTIEDGVVNNGSGIYIGPGSSNDTAHIQMRNLFIADVKTCITQNNLQAVDIVVENWECADPTAAIGGYSIGSNGGIASIRHMYYTPGARS